MKTQNFKKSFFAVAAIAGLTLSTINMAAQDSSNAAANPAAPQAAPVQLSYGVMQIVQLSQAKVSDSTIATFIQNSRNSYGLDANQIIYLRQQGVSDAIVNIMLNQPKNVAANQVASQSTSPQNATSIAPPATTVVQSPPASTVYVIPDTQTYNYDAYYYQPYYYPYYGSYYGWGYPGVSLSFGVGGRWGGGYYHGGGWGHGGFHGGGHR